MDSLDQALPESLRNDIPLPTELLRMVLVEIHREGASVRGKDDLSLYNLTSIATVARRWVPLVEELICSMVYLQHTEWSSTDCRGIQEHFTQKPHHQPLVKIVDFDIFDPSEIQWGELRSLLTGFNLLEELILTVSGDEAFSGTIPFLPNLRRLDLTWETGTSAPLLDLVPDFPRMLKLQCLHANGITFDPATKWPVECKVKLQILTIWGMVQSELPAFQILLERSWDTLRALTLDETFHTPEDWETLLSFTGRALESLSLYMGWDSRSCFCIPPTVLSLRALVVRSNSGSVLSRPTLGTICPHISQMKSLRCLETNLPIMGSPGTDEALEETSHLHLCALKIETHQIDEQFMRRVFGPSQWTLKGLGIFSTAKHISGVANTLAFFSRIVESLEIPIRATQDSLKSTLPFFTSLKLLRLSCDRKISELGKLLPSGLVYLELRGSEMDCEKVMRSTLEGLPKFKCLNMKELTVWDFQSMRMLVRDMQSETDVIEKDIGSIMCREAEWARKEREVLEMGWKFVD